MFVGTDTDTKTIDIVLENQVHHGALFRLLLAMIFSSLVLWYVV